MNLKNIKFFSLIVVAAGLLLSLRIFDSAPERYIFYHLDDKNKSLFPFSIEDYELIAPADENVYLAKINNKMYLKVNYQFNMQISSGVYNSIAINYDSQGVGYLYNYYNIKCHQDTEDVLICQRTFDDNKAYLFYSLVSTEWKSLNLPIQVVINLFNQEFAEDKSVNIKDYWIGHLYENKYIIFLHDKGYCGGSAGCWPGVYLYEDSKLKKIGDFGAVDCDYGEDTAFCTRTFADNH